MAPVDEPLEERSRDSAAASSGVRPIGASPPMSSGAETASSVPGRGVPVSATASSPGTRSKPPPKRARRREAVPATSSEMERSVGGSPITGCSAERQVGEGAVVEAGVPAIHVNKLSTYRNAR
jgi:hypothetical protein